MIAHPSASQKACSCAIICWKVGIEGASYQTLDDGPRPADNRSMQRGAYAVLPLLMLAVAACGSPTGKALDTKVEAAVVAQQGGRQVVSSVDCSDQAPPTDTVAGGLGTVAADHTCTVKFSNGTPTQVWAVNVLDLGASHPVQLLYRTDHNGDGQPAATVDVAKAFSAEMALLNGGTATTAHCKAGSPAAPAGSTATATPDHVCSIRIPGHGRQRWAVRILGSNVQLLFQLG
jgi:hypothetical protein